MSISKKNDPKFIMAYDRGMLRSAFVSLFWAVIQERKKAGGFTLVSLAKKLSTNKAEVSRWFSGDPNWTVNTIASLANVLDLEITIQAKERATGRIYTPAGIQITASKAHEIRTPSRVESGLFEARQFSPPKFNRAGMFMAPETSSDERAAAA